MGFWDWLTGGDSTQPPADVPEVDVVAAKVVPPELSAEAMQRVAEAGWPPFETAPLGEWTLRASGGLTGRANSVRVAGDPGARVDEDGDHRGPAQVVMVTVMATVLARARRP